uniref:Uncharacterized protein LOC101495757 n=1 Tax=Cicer arietinum TaxID=3827 RepID=A0A3Q7XIN0_CICAR|nr:uncharacterized protein LOC101495757 [Cicer arietinum]
MQAFACLRILDLSYNEYITEIPDVSGLPDLEKLSFKHCENLTKIHDSVGYLGSLKILDASSCKNLKTFPPIILTSLEQLNLSHCSTLESFPEILGKMENITELYIMGSPIKELPFSIQNFTRLQKLELRICGKVLLPSCIVKLPELSLIHVSKCEGLWLPKQYKGKEMVLQSSNMDRLILSHCNIFNDFLPVGLKFFSNVKDLDLSGNNFTTIHEWIEECHFLRYLKVDNCSHLQRINGIPNKLEIFSAKECTSLKCLDLTVLPACTTESCSLKELILDGCVYLQEIISLPQNLDIFSAKSCTSLTSQSINMLLNQEGVEAGNNMFFFPGKNIPEWFTPRTSVKKVPTSRVATKQEIEGSLYFQFRNKFPTICLCLVIGLGNEQPIQVKFSLQVFINGNKKRIGCQQVYEFKIDTDHVFLLKIEDNEDIVFSDNKWNSVEVSFVDHITNDEEPIRQVSRYSGIHVFEQTIDPEDIQFIDASQRMINTNLNPNSMEGAHQKVKITAERPQKDQTNVLSSPIVSSTQLRPPIIDAKIVGGPKPMLPNKMSSENVIEETSERLPEEEVHPTSIPNDPLVIQICSEGDDIELEAVSSSEESSSEIESSDSDDPFDCVSNRFNISAKEAISSGSCSGDASLGIIRETINALALLMVKELSEVSCDPDTQSRFHQLLDVLSTSSHPKMSVELKEAIVEFQRKAFLSIQEFQSTIESVNKLKDFEKHLDEIKQETMAGKGRRKDLKNSIKKVSLDIKAENSRINESEAEIVTLRKQLDTKEMDLEKFVLNLKNQEGTLSTYSTSYASLNEHARALLEEVDDLLAASSGVKHEGEAAKLKQSRLKATWSMDLTTQFNKIKNNIINRL